MPNQSKQGLLSPFLQKIRFKEISKNIKKDFSNLNEVDVLDYGCGDGYFSNIFSKEKYVGYDLDENIIYKNKKKGNGYVFETRINEQKKFDVIILSAVLEHLPDPNGIMIKLKKMLKNSSSKIYVTTPNKYFIFIHDIGSKFGFFSKDAADEHDIIFSKSDLINLTKKTNFKILRFKYFLCYANQLLVLGKN